MIASLPQHQEITIFNYHNRKLTGRPLNNELTQVLKILPTGLVVCYKDQPSESQDSISFDKLQKIKHLKIKRENMEVVAVQLKNDPKPQISFRVPNQQIAKHIENLVTKKMQQMNNLPDYTYFLDYHEKLIERIKELQPHYRQIYTGLQKNISRNKLKKLLFSDHPDMINYQRQARQQGIAKNKQIMLKNINQIPKKPMEEQFVYEGYDLDKKLEGIRVEDQEMKRQYEPLPEQKQDQLFFDQLPPANIPNITDQFYDIDEQVHLQKEPATIKLDSDKEIVKTVIIPQPQKGKYRIHEIKPVKQKLFSNRNIVQSEEQINIYQAKKITLLMKVFYRLIAGPAQQKQVTAICDQLNRLKYQSKLPQFLEQPLVKTIKNTLQWQRQNQKRRHR